MTFAYSLKGDSQGELRISVSELDRVMQLKFTTARVRRSSCSLEFDRHAMQRLSGKIVGDFDPPVLIASRHERLQLEGIAWCSAKRKASR